MNERSTAGRCLCGEVRFEVRGPLRAVLVCHCRECRRWAGHAWAATAALRDDLVVEGKTLTWIQSPDSDSGARRGFCSSCGSSLFWEAAGSRSVSIAAGALDEPTGLRIAAHVYTSHVGDYYALPDDDVPRFQTLSGSPTAGQGRS
jgi:hypothetical protein